MQQLQQPQRAYSPRGRESMDLEEEQRWPRGLLRDLDTLSFERADAPPSRTREEAYRRRPLPSYARLQPPPPQRTVRFPPDLRVDTSMETDAKPLPPPQQAGPQARKSLILCFDGTGNKFSGTPADSNILKIYSMLDKEDRTVYRYYQPGIGTYVEELSLATKSHYGRVKSWYTKAKDQAVGTSFGEHVMAGYKFLMRYYAAGDDIYFFGMFGYETTLVWTLLTVWRRLQQRRIYCSIPGPNGMKYSISSLRQSSKLTKYQLDYIGLLSTGNEEMLRFAWKTFSRWQTRTDSTAEEKREKHATYHFMSQFRETFSRPIDPIRFVGLFDCVNSVPQFESAWMKRSRFPYTAKMSARTIRHAVAIDERRAKFRQDLVSEQRGQGHRGSHGPHELLEHLTWHHGAETPEKPPPRPALAHRASSQQDRFRPRRHPHAQHLAPIPVSSGVSQTSVDSTAVARERRTERHRANETVHPDNDDDSKQDILEVWFAGEHADVGGGWRLNPGEQRPASDIPLIWMLREARRAGMPLDETRLAKARFGTVEPGTFAMNTQTQAEEVPALGVDSHPVARGGSLAGDAVTDAEVHHLATRTRLHDSLDFNGGLPWPTVLLWLIFEHLPFRRMDLQPDGSWKPISWPLPRGEVRDMPEHAVVHGSVLRRMRADGGYRPGNVIVGGGGRGIRRAPESAGMGVWRSLGLGEDVIGERFVRDSLASIGKAL